MTAILFAAGSLALVVLSRKSLLRPGTHGFLRLFAWEAILGLALVNVPFWFREPLVWHQAISWPLLTVSILPLVLGILQLRRSGKGDRGARAGEELYTFERTTALVTSGMFSLIRHPLHSSLLIPAWGIFVKEPSALGGLLAIAATVALVLAAKRDEAECLQAFGAQYRDYMRHTRMFIPYLV